MRIALRNLNLELRRKERKINEGIKSILLLYLGNITTSQILYLKHFTLRMLIESEDINPADIDVINLGLKNEEFYDIQNMIQTAVSKLKPTYLVGQPNESMYDTV